MPRRQGLVCRLPSPVVALLTLMVLAPTGNAGTTPPQGRSLAPLDGDSVRQRYGQEALFRLRLGVDASSDDGRSCPARPTPWLDSAEHRQVEQNLTSGHPYAAGLVLGSWQLRQQRCQGADPASLTPARPPQG